MGKFAEDIRNLDVEIDRKQREMDNLDKENNRLKRELEDLKMKEAGYN